MISLELLSTEGFATIVAAARHSISSISTLRVRDIATDRDTSMGIRPRGVNIEWGPQGPERGPQGPNQSLSNSGIRRHVPLPFECADPETVSARHPGVCQEVASLLLGLTGETLTLNRSHTPTQRSREYFTLRSIGDRGRPLYRLSVHIGCTGVSPSSQYIYKCGHTSFTLCGPPRYAPFTLCGSARCSTGQPVAIQHFFLLCGSARCASFAYCGSARG